ncbi:TPA: hypothetical protein ACGSTT_003821 [Vibrio parahaemolyticus]|uniref:hypothetical protein n=1 Tax=Vibrio parahaemolyticus TaxID=670 RepID=UPI0011227628|nr:hypothetical protein [Vibrio parahaemolyticus]MCG7792177.1 hypothetical protein [Vibrio parahaemolyticus]TOH10045.1 hypothetical protein CGI90_22240 [Vibrio parahaemolyticus]
MIFRTSKAIASSIEDVPDGMTAALSNYRFTAKVEQRIHKKGGEYLNYSFMLNYRFWLGFLVPLPMMILGLLALFDTFEADFPQEIADMVYLNQGALAMYPRFLGAWILGGAFFISVHIIFGIRHAVKYKIVMLFFDFLWAGLSGALHTGFVWAFTLFWGAQIF